VLLRMPRGPDFGGDAVAPQAALDAARHVLGTLVVFQRPWPAIDGPMNAGEVTPDKPIILRQT
jgi:hypothetical protein